MSSIAEQKQIRSFQIAQLAATLLNGVNNIVELDQAVDVADELLRKAEDHVATERGEFR